MTDDIKKGKAGSSFEEFLKEEGTYEETTKRAVKRVLAFQNQGHGKQNELKRVERPQTSRR